LALFSRCSGELCSPCVPNQPKLALFSRAAVAAVSSPPELKQRLALFFRHFWIKYFILNHIVALFPLKITPFRAISWAWRRQLAYPASQQSRRVTPFDSPFRTPDWQKPTAIRTLPWLPPLPARLSRLPRITLSHFGETNGTDGTDGTNYFLRKPKALGHVNVTGLARFSRPSIKCGLFHMRRTYEPKGRGFYS